MSQFSLAGDPTIDIDKATFKHERYQLVSKIASGNEGVVWKANNSDSGTSVAIKLYRDKQVWKRDIKEIRKRSGGGSVMEK